MERDDDWAAIRAKREPKFIMNISEPVPAKFEARFNGEFEPISSRFRSRAKMNVGVDLEFRSGCCLTFSGIGRR